MRAKIQGFDENAKFNRYAQKFFSLFYVFLFIAMCFSHRKEAFRRVCEGIAKPIFRQTQHKIVTKKAKRNKFCCCIHTKNLSLHREKIVIYRF